MIELTENMNVEVYRGLKTVGVCEGAGEYCGVSHCVWLQVPLCVK